MNTKKCRKYSFKGNKWKSPPYKKKQKKSEMEKK